MLQVWGSLVIFLVCPLLGALPLIEGIALIFIGRKLSSLGTGNVSVSAAFYHGGKVVGILAVLSEAAKGIAAVLLARAFFPVGSGWELVALLALVVGRYWGGKGAGTTNVVWGITAHDPIAAFLIFLIGGISFTIFRDRASGRLVVLILLALILSLRHAENLPYIAAAIALSGLMGCVQRLFLLRMHGSISSSKTVPLRSRSKCSNSKWKRSNFNKNSRNSRTRSRNFNRPIKH